MQARTSHLFTEFFDFEEKHSNREIVELLKTYLNTTAMLPLLDNVNFSLSHKDNQLLSQSKFNIDRMEAMKDKNVTIYEKHIAAIQQSQPTRGLLFNYQIPLNIIFPMAKNNLYCLTLLGNLCENLAKLYSNLEDPKQAVAWSLSALQVKIAAHVLSPNHGGTEIANSFNSLGLLCNQQGQYKISEMCYEYALSIAIDCRDKSERTTFIGCIYYNSSLNYIAMSQCKTLIENTNTSLTHNAGQIDNAISCLFLADNNLARIKPSNEISIENILRLRQQIKLEKQKLNRLKEITLPKAVSTVASSDTELTEEEHIQWLIESTVNAVINDKVSESSAKISVASLPSNPALQTTTISTTSGESKRALTLHLPVSQPTQVMPPSSNRRSPQTTMPTTSSKGNKTSQYNSHRRCNEEQERLYAKHQIFQAEQRILQMQQVQQAWAYQCATSTFFQHPLNFRVPSFTNSIPLIKPRCETRDWQHIKELGHNTPLYKKLGSS